MITQAEQIQISDLWQRHLPVCYPKTIAKQKLSNYMNISVRNVEKRIVGNKIFTNDLFFIYNNLGIGFDLQKGFFLDQLKFEEIQAAENSATAAKYGLSKIKDYE